MKKHYFLGLAAKNKDSLKFLSTRGNEKDYTNLKRYLGEKYNGEAILCKNGRSALTLALMAYFNKGEKILVNGFTCYAVYEAVKAAGLIPVFVDISQNDLNFNVESLSKATDKDCAGIIVQNTLGNPVDIKAIERFAGENGLIIIEDLAHCVGIKYKDGREAGTVGAATALSFGKEKSIDTVSGGALVLRYPCNLLRKNSDNVSKTTKIPGRRVIAEPDSEPKRSDILRSRWYPTFAKWCRGLTRIHLNGILMRILLKFHWVEKSADNKLDLKRLPATFEAKFALEQFKNLKKNGEPPIRTFYLVHNRDEVLVELKRAGYYFDGFWYEKPVSPERYYKKVHFDEEKCPVATRVAKEIINFPTYYPNTELKDAYKIVENYLVKGEENG